MSMDAVEPEPLIQPALMGRGAGGRGGRQAGALHVVLAWIFLPVAGLLTSTLLTGCLSALASGEWLLSLLVWALGDEIYAKVAQESLTHVYLGSNAPLAAMPWGLGIGAEGTVLARTIVAWGTGLILLAVGIDLARGDAVPSRWQKPRVLAALAYQLIAVNTLFHYRLSPAALDAMGLAAVVTKLGGNSATSYVAVATGLAVLWPGGFLGAVYGAAALRAWWLGARHRLAQAGLIALVVLAWQIVPPAGNWVALASSHWPGVEGADRRSPPEGGQTQGLPLQAAAPAGRGGVQRTDAGSAHPSDAVAGPAPMEPMGALPAIPAGGTTAAATGADATSDHRAASLDSVGAGTEPPEPSRVELRETVAGYELVRNGRPIVLKGMGYSNMVAVGATAEARRQKWDEDLRLIAASGFNTLNGWVDQYHTEPWSAALLDIAQRHGLGVILPYYLRPDLDYTDPAVRAVVKADVRRWVEQHKRHPALLMWGLGNEVLHRIGLKQPDRARAFARFYWELADFVHELDPNHPVSYRDAEVLYLDPLQAAYQGSGDRRAWFALGMNVYTAGRKAEHFREVLDSAWPQRRWPVPAYVSEFNPTGLDGRSRPAALVAMWRVIRKNSRRFLGGSVYVWSAAGPEVIDRAYGLVDVDNRPVDGALDALRVELAKD